MPHTITLIPGDGIGTEVSKAVQQIIDAAGVAICWELANARGDVENPSADFMQSPS